MEPMVLTSATIDPVQLRAFVEIARRGGVSAAAETLGIAKSAVSRHLSRLEEAIGLKLFGRSARRVSLTFEGRELLPKAQSIIADLDAFLTEAQEGYARVRGTVRIAGSPEFGEVIARRILPALRAQHPDLNVVLSLNYGIDDLHDPGVDVAFRLGAVGDDRLIARELGRFSRVLVCSAGYREAHDLNVPDDLAHADMLMFSRGVMAEEIILHHVDEPGLRHVVPVNGRLAIRGFNALAGAAEAGLGVAALPNFVAKSKLEAGSLVRVLPEFASPPVTIFIAYRPNVAKIRRVRAVIDVATELSLAQGGLMGRSGGSNSR